ncbi:TPA: helix-turn-helix domain-containing protein [Streptococcus suis]|nr:helix-turn-helix domain-containing protein [Streptococcus suis]
MTSKDQLQQLFPKGRISTSRSESEELQLPLSDGVWFTIPKEDLTERELGLVNLLFGELSQDDIHPWARYFHGIGSIPQQLITLQVIHIHIWTVLDEDTRQTWLDMMTKLLPNLKAFYTTNGHDFTFVLEQSTQFDVREILGDTLSAMEFDFGLRMTVFLGQIWPENVVGLWPDLVMAEQSIFAKWRKHHHQSSLLTFSQLYLWVGQLYPVLKEGLAPLIVHQQLEKEILALWQEGAVLTKAAQSLYIHRNTLQYRLDKWYDWTGLQLKDLTDLAVCYMVIVDMNL